MRLALSLRRCAAAGSALRARAALLRAGARRGMATSQADKEKLIAQYPYPWPWGQTIDVKTPRYDLKIKIPQDAPAPKQHKLAYKIDPAPPSVPEAPTQFIGPAGKATHLLFAAAVKAGRLDQYQNVLNTLAATVDSKRDVRVALMNPRTTVDDKIEYVKELAGSAGADGPLLDQIVNLQKEKRFHKIGQISRNFGVLVAEHRKEKHGAIISAEPLTEQQYSAITAKMQALVKPDEKLIVTREVEPALVGGFIVRVGNRAQDLSVQAQIKRMEAHLKEFFTKNQDAVDKVLTA